MKENIIKEKTYNFAIRIINLYKYLIHHKKEFILSKQVLRSGTSIGANIEEALGGFSKKDFIAKLTISYKEARETYYWLRLLKDTDYISEEQAKSLFLDCDEICKIIARIKITMINKENS